MKIRKGDTIKILVGKDAGRQGKIVKVMPGSSRIVVEGINIFKKHMKGNGKDKQSAIIDISKSVHRSNVMVICPHCGKPTRIGYSAVNGAKVRVCRKCKKTFDHDKQAPVKSTKTSEVKTGAKTGAKK